ncbi:MAG: dinitrogenase iron-molybdenum cofactor biosynthesis protein [Butyrivibrio sp.]|nr:dinitrogenase iron-molybdenum cofactor biosynthesis protein [Butyrivibrio sp.]
MDKAIYRVALASTDNRYVDQHFGRAESFLIVDVDENGNYEEIEQRFVEPVCNGGHHDAANLKRGVEGVSDCNFVLAARIGDGARSELEERGIAAFEMPGEVRLSLHRLDGYLKLLQEMNKINGK